MDGEKFKRRLRECELIIESLPADQRARLRDLLEETKARHAQIGDAMAEALGALDDWRVQQKYRLFDREAQSRESRPS